MGSGDEVITASGCVWTYGSAAGGEAASAGKFSLLGDTALTAGGDVSEFEVRWLGRRGGGGAGAWMLTRKLEERDLVESTEDRRKGESGSSGPTVDCDAAAVTLLSVRPCGWRLGGGAGFLDWVFEAVRDGFGGVGGLGDMVMPSPYSISGSGTLPAATRSNTLSASSSAGSLCGAGGSGLLTSDGVGGLCLDGEVRGIVVFLRVGLGNDRGDLAPASVASPLVSVLINFPCRELGGGGFFLKMVGPGCKLD
jgi:hypothetical protein